MPTPTNDRATELMTAYLDDALDPSEAEAFESYLAQSPEAQAELEDLRKVVALVGSLPEVEAPSDFYENVHRKLRRRQLLRPDGIAMSLVSLPFQVLSIIVILTIAALYMMAQLDQQPTRALEKDPSPATAFPRDPAEPHDRAEPPIP